MTDTITTTFSVGDRVRLIGETYGRYAVGDAGTVTDVNTGYLTVMMDKTGVATTAYLRRWEKVTDGNTTPPAAMSEADARAVWAALPIEEAYPIGSQWHHSSYGDNVHTVERHTNAHNLMMRDEYSGMTNEWPRGALDNYGTPVGLIPSTPVDESTDTTPEPTEATAEPYRPVVGDRVVVVEDQDNPRNVGMTAVVIETKNSYGSLHHAIKVRFDEGQSSHYSHDTTGWWVKEVRPEMPATPEEYRAAIAAAVEKATEEAKREGRREGRAAAAAEAASQLDSIVESAHQYAQDNSLCSQFDRFMVENGLPPRDSYTQDYRVTVTYDVYVSARPDDEDAIRDAAMERINSGWESPEFDWEEN